MSVLPRLIRETGSAGSDPDASVIWLHGLGADGHDFEPVVPELGLPADLSIRFVFPHAPPRPVTLNGGYVMPAWYDFWIGEDGIEHRKADVLESARAIRLLIEQERMHGIEADRILLAGFSQGAAMALFTGLTHHEGLGGIIALSGYLPLPRRLDAVLTPAARDTPVFLAHGEADEVVPLRLGEATHRWLADHDIPARFSRYPMGHGVCAEEIQDIGGFIAERLAGG
ncbi:MAG: carboxylesterase [Mariprofundaceae bacterium]